MNARTRLPTSAWVSAVICALAMLWVGAGTDRLADAFQFSGRKADYYSLLVSGFTRGHLYMDVAVDPRLSSPDPKVVAQTPTLQDANFYKGHFYLYYGVVPAALLLLPYRLMTGQDLGTNIACLLFWLLGFAASLYWLRRWWSDTSSKGGQVLAALAVALLAFFPATTFLVRRAMFYELPLIAGFAFISIFFAALYEGIHGRRPLVAVAISSVALGLAVGCHPNHVFLFPILLVVAWSIARGDAERRISWPIATASVLPAALIGAALAWYNYARFGDAFEFGFRYGQNEFFTAKESLVVPRFFWANFKWYFLTPPALVPCFPFFYPGNNTFRPAGYVGAEAMHGALAGTLLAVWILIGLVAIKRARPAASSVSRHLAVLSCSFFAGLLFVGSLQIRANRYMADFETPLAWLLACGGCVVWSGISTGVASRIWRLGFTLLVLAGSLFYVLASVQQFELFRNTRPLAYSKASRALNVPYRWIYDAGSSPAGLLSMSVRFKQQSDLSIEPLVTTGTPGYSDSVNVAQYPNHLVQFRFDHRGYGGPASPFITIDLKKEHLIEISMGSFYPPNDDGYFGDVPVEAANLVKKLAYVRLDGRVVICKTASFYEAPPWSKQIASNDTTLTEFERTFSGIVERSSVVPIDLFLDDLNAEAHAGVFSYKVRFPDRAPLSGLPILGCGVQGDGNLIFARAGPGTSYRMAMDDWGNGAQIGRPFDVTQREHTLEIVLGPILVRSKLPSVYQEIGNFTSLADRIFVRLDGKMLGVFKVEHHLNQIAKLTPASNPQGFSTATPRFDGAFTAFPMTDADVRDLLSDAFHESTP